MKRINLPLSKTTIEKLSTANTDTICQFLKNLKCVIDELEHQKQLKLENNQNFPLFIISNGDMIQVSGIMCKIKIALVLSNKF